MSNHVRPEDSLSRAALEEAKELCRGAEVLPDGQDGLAAVRPPGAEGVAC